MNIVIVESSRAARLKLRKMVEQLGHSVVAEAETGKAALDACARFRPDLVTVDLGVADMEPHALIAQIAKAQRGVRILVVGTHSRASHVLATMKVGATHFLLKPIRKNGVAKALERVEKFSLAA